MPTLDVQLHLFFQGQTVTGAYSSEHSPVEETPVEAYLDRSLAYGRPVCCSMMGAFAVWVDGKLWMRYRVADAEDKDAVPPTDLLLWNALDTTLAMIWGVSELLDGKRMADLGSHDDEDPIILHLDEENRVRHEMEMFDPDFEPIPLLPFARLILREGEKMHAFSHRLRAAIHNRLAAEPMDSPLIMPLKHRIELIERWELEKILLKIRKQLAMQA